MALVLLNSLFTGATSLKLCLVWKRFTPSCVRGTMGEGGGIAWLDYNSVNLELPSMRETEKGKIVNLISLNKQHSNLATNESL
jgi:hypothetical protein